MQESTIMNSSPRLAIRVIHARIAEATSTAIQLGENWWGPHDMTGSIAAHASNHIMLDVMKIGGVSGWLRAAALAEAAGLSVSSHIFPEFSAHLLGVTPIGQWLEYLNIGSSILMEPVRIQDGYAMMPNRPGSWIHAGLRLLATSGIDTVKVETLTKELHISKGSFYHYWHTRSEFLGALIACWEERGTRRVIDELEKIPAPQERFQRLFETSFSTDKKLEAAIHQWANVDATMAGCVAATEEVRVAYITKLLCDMGKPFTQASALARLCYFVYLGWIDWSRRNDPAAGTLPEIQQTLWALVFT